MVELEADNGRGIVWTSTTKFRVQLQPAEVAKDVGVQRVEPADIGAGEIELVHTCFNCCAPRF